MSVSVSSSIDGYKVAGPLQGYEGNDLYLVRAGPKEGVYSASKRALVVPINFAHISYLGPDTFSLRIRDMEYGIFSAEKQELFPMQPGSWVFAALSPNLIQVWAGRVCGLYSLNEKRLVLPIEYDSMTVKGNKIVADGITHIKEIPIK